jgi:hypothetical protein
VEFCARGTGEAAGEEGVDDGAKAGECVWA